MGHRVQNRLQAFTGGKDGANPQAALVQASDGNFYGTTAYTVFRLSIVREPPELTITASGGNVVLAWPTATGFTLQSTTNLASPIWTTNSHAPVVVNGQNTVTNPISSSQQSFRLSQ